MTCLLLILRLVVQRIGYEHPQYVPHSVQLSHMSGELSLLPRGGAACLLSRETPRNMKPSDRPKKVCQSIISKTELSSSVLHWPVARTRMTTVFGECRT